MRLIDAEELMEHVWRDKLDSRELIAKMIDDAPTVKEISTKIPINVFEQLISQESKTRHWIPVSERLPEEREWYLAVFKEIDTGYQLIPRVADYIGNGENKWRIIDEDGLVQEYRSILECVAWMPLPKPYKAESEDKE